MLGGHLLLLQTHTPSHSSGDRTNLRAGGLPLILSLAAAQAFCQAFCDTAILKVATTTKCAGWPTHRTATDSTLYLGDFRASVCGGRDTMSRQLILAPETLNGRLLLALSVLAAVMMIQAILGASPALAISETPDDTYMTNGRVYATALSGDGKVLYIGGEFTEVSQKSGASHEVSNLAAINVKTGNAIGTWRPEVDGKDAVVRSLAVQNGKVFIGGNFTTVEGKPRKNLAAVGAYTKTVVLSPFKPEVGGDASYVFALEAGDRKLYAGGGFSKVDGAPRKNLAAFSLETGALDRHWKPKATKAPTCKDPKCSHKVRTLELGPGGRSIFVGGSFSYVSGTNGRGGPRQSVARLYTGTGNLHPWKVPGRTIKAPQTAWDLTATRTRLYGGFGARRNFLAAFRLDKGNSGARLWRFSTVGKVQSVGLK